jgi:hypothetical protein
MARAAGRTSIGRAAIVRDFPQNAYPGLVVPVQHSCGMETITIRAASAESAQEMQAALAAFQPRLLESSGTYTILVHLLGDAQIVAILKALQDYVCERGDGAARVDFEGRSYTLHPEVTQPSGL